MKIIIPFTLIMTGLIISFSGCSSKESSVSTTIPPELETLAQQFRAATGEDKIELGKRIRSLLPTCEIRDTAGNVISYNYGRPSYRLSREDVIRLLGQPDEIIEGDYIYHSGEDHKYAWSLSVEFIENYVVAGRIDYTWKKSR